jgi:hypothetical protein
MNVRFSIGRARAGATAVVVSVAFASAFSARDASAADPEAGLALERLDRPEAGSRFYASDTLSLREPWRPAFGVQMGYTYRPFSIVEPDGTRSSLVRNVWSTDASASIVIPGGMRFGLSMPFVLYQDGRDTSFGVQSVTAPESPAAGDIRVSGDVYVVGRAEDPFSAAVGVAVYVPTGSRSAFTSDSTARVYPRALMTGKYRHLRWGARAGYMLRPHVDQNFEPIYFGGVEIGSEMLAGASVGYENGPFVVGPEIFMSTVVSSKAGPFAKDTTPVEALASGHYKITDRFVCGAGVGTRLTDGLGAAAFRAVASLEWINETKPLRDKDGDGVPDDEDMCPDLPGCDEHEPGCPAPSIDTNGDGIPDYEPQCLTMPGERKQVPEIPPPSQDVSPPPPQEPTPTPPPPPEQKPTPPAENKPSEPEAPPPAKTWGG